MTGNFRRPFYANTSNTVDSLESILCLNLVILLTPCEGSNNSFINRIKWLVDHMCPPKNPVAVKMFIPSEGSIKIQLLFPNDIYSTRIVFVKLKQSLSPYQSKVMFSTRCCICSDSYHYSPQNPSRQVMHL